MQKLGGKKVLITGGAVRLGRAVAMAFAENGASVIIHYHESEDEAYSLRDDLVREYGGQHYLVKADLTRRQERAGLISGVVEQSDGLDCLVNNASVYRRSYLRDVEEEDFQRDYDINFVAPFVLMREFCRLVGSGSIINLLDQRIAITDPAGGSYACAKKSLRDVTEAAAVEWAPAIRVNGVAPGVVLPPPGVSKEKMKPLIKHIPMQQKTSLGEIAEACVFLAAAETITGTILYVDGGLHLKPNALGETSPGA